MRDRAGAEFQVGAGSPADRGRSPSTPGGGEAMRAKAVHGSTSKGVLAASAGAAALALAAAGCGSAGTTPAAGGASATHHAMASHSPATTEPARFGPDCGMVPATGMGSFHGM